MALQARAEATRRRILDSAVDLFDELGYGETGLADVLQRANVSKGAFYYHFDSKEAVATAIIEEYRRTVKEATEAKVDPAARKLDWLILSTFVSAELLESNKNARIGNQLLQALSQISSAANHVYSQWTTLFVNALAEGFEEAGVREGVDPVESAEAAWASVLGSHLLTSALGSDAFTGMARAWRSILRAVLPDDRLEDYYRLVERREARYQAVN